MVEDDNTHATTTSKNNVEDSTSEVASSEAAAPALLGGSSRFISPATHNLTTPSCHPSGQSRVLVLLSMLKRLQLSSRVVDTASDRTS